MFSSVIDFADLLLTFIFKMQVYALLAFIVRPFLEIHEIDIHEFESFIPSIEIESKHLCMKNNRYRQTKLF